MKIFTYGLILLFGTLFFQTQTNLWAQSQVQMLSPDQLKSDFYLFRTALEEIHPEMFRYTSPKTFDSIFTATKEGLNHPMSQQEFYKAMLPSLVSLRDGHIKWIVAGQDQHYPFHTNQLFPLNLYFVEKRSWVAGNFGEDKLPEGAEIVSINGTPIATIVEALLPNIFFADGYTVNGKYYELNHFFSGYYATHFGGHDQFEVAYKVDNIEKVAMVKSVSKETIKAYAERENNSDKKPYQLSFPHDNTALLTIRRFWGDKKEYKSFLEETFRKLKAQNIQNLVLDIRNNEGGDESFGILLYSYLAKNPFLYYDHISINPVKECSIPVIRPKHYNFLRKLLVRKTDAGYLVKGVPGLKLTKPRHNNFQGELYVLLNGSSFSVTTEFAARVHADHRATFIGQETGGGYEGNSSGIFSIVQLPNSKIDLGIPMLGFHMANLPASIKKGQGIIPDYQLTPTIEEVLRNRDTELEYALQLIQEKGIARTDKYP